MISYLPDISFYSSVHTEIIHHLTRSLRGGSPGTCVSFSLIPKDLFVRKPANLLLASAREDLLSGTKLLLLEVEIEKKKKKPS